MTTFLCIYYTNSGGVVRFRRNLVGKCFSNVTGVSLRLVLKLLSEYPSMHILELKVKVKVALEQATKAQRWSRCIALLFL